MKYAAKLILAAFAAVAAMPAMAHNGEMHCSHCKEWNVAQKPFKIYGNTWYVGTAELSALLVTSPEGHILLDGALPQSAPLIEANIKALGFRMEDVKLILNSHAHFDHAGGIARLARASGATVVASAHGAKVLEDGDIGKDDPQYDPTFDSRIEKIAAVRSVADGATVRVGTLALTAHLTPGHTPGSTTWTWNACENQRCLDIVYADSLNAAAEGSFRFSDDERWLAFTENGESAQVLDLVALRPVWSQQGSKVFEPEFAAARVQSAGEGAVPGQSCGSYFRSTGKVRLQKFSGAKASQAGGAQQPHYRVLL